MPGVYMYQFSNDGESDFFQKIPYFNRHEFACKCGCGFDAVDVELLFVLIDLREHFGRPVEISGPNRCFHHNRDEGGADDSEHVNGVAGDVKVQDIHPDKVADYLEDKYPDKYGIGRYRGRTHIDTRPYKARWDNR